MVRVMIKRISDGSLLNMFEVEPKSHNECFNAETQFVFESIVDALKDNKDAIAIIEPVRD